MNRDLAFAVEGIALILSAGKTGLHPLFYSLHAWWYALLSKNGYSNTFRKSTDITCCVEIVLF